MLTWLTEEVSARPVGLARIMVGAAAATRALIALPLLLRLAESERLKAPHFEWMPAPSIELAWGLSVVWFVSAVLFAVGWRVPVTGPVLLASVVFFLALDHQTYGNHLYLMAWLVFLLTLARSGSALALGGSESPIVRWPIILLMTQTSVVYGFAGLTKLQSDFLSGGILAVVLRGGPISFPESLNTPGALSVLAAGAVFTELFVAVFVWSPRLRSIAFLMGVGLHTAIILFMSATAELIVFATMMFSLYPIFLTDETLEVRYGSGWGPLRHHIARHRRFDLLRLIRVSPETAASGVIETLGSEGTRTGYAATVVLRERLVPHLWIAGLLRIPGLRALDRRRYAHGSAS